MTHCVKPNVSRHPIATQCEIHKSMRDYQQTIQKLTNSIMNFSFEFNFEEVKKELEIREVSKIELEQLGEIGVRQKFNASIYKIQLPDGKLIDANSIAKYSAENNITEPVIFINPDFKYVQWTAKKDFTKPQLKKHIKEQLAKDSDLELTEIQKALIEEDVKNRKIEGYIDKLAIKTSTYISEGKFFIQSSCTSESAHKIINEVVEELKTDAKKYVGAKMKRDYRNIIIYLIFVTVVSFIWLINKQDLAIPNWLSNIIGLLLLLIPLVVMRLINHSFIDSLLFGKKAKKKYEKEFFDKAK